MNSFNSTKNQVVRNTESPEGGAGQINGTTELNPNDLVNAELKAQEGEVKEGSIEEAEAGETFDLESIDSLIEQTARNIEVINTMPFEVDPETGLSLQGNQIEDLKTQLTALENDEATKLAISTEIEANRAQTREVLKTRLEQYKSIREGINNKIQATINQSNQTNLSIEEFISGNEALQAKVTELDQTIISATEALDAFEAETSAQVEQSIEARKTELQQQLTEAQTNYTESGAEANDKPILLEQAQRELEETLSKTEFTKTVDGVKSFYISDKNLGRIFELYGYVVGMDRIKKLKTDSGVYSGSEQTERDIQYFANTAKERELNQLREESSILQRELDEMESDPAYQEALYFDRTRDLDKLSVSILLDQLGPISSEFRLTDKGFELKEDYQKTLEELSSQITVNIQSIDTELNSLQESISNIRALRDFRVPEGRNFRIGQLKQIEDYLEQNKSKSRWNPNKDQNAISKLSPILENLKLKINEQDKYRNEYSSINSEFDSNSYDITKLNEIYNRSEYIKSKLSKTELTDKSSIIKAVNEVKEYIDNYQTPDDFDVKKSQITELRKKIDTLSQKEKGVRRI